jgi:hypothetical protein
LKEIIAITSDGVPYLRPEVQLLYKGWISARREKDLLDMKTMMPLLEKAEIRWIHESLSHQFCDGLLACMIRIPWKK